MLNEKHFKQPNYCFQCSMRLEVQTGGQSCQMPVKCCDLIAHCFSCSAVIAVFFVVVVFLFFLINSSKPNDLSYVNKVHLLV